MFTINKETLNDFSESSRLDWIDTNGLGGYASSTVLGLNTRRYHGLLVTALNPPVEREVIVSKLDETLIIKNIFYILLIALMYFTSGCVQLEATVSALGGNNLPVVESIVLDPLVIQVGTTATIKVNVYDPDGDRLTYSWSTPLGDIIGSGSQVRYSAAFCCVGSNSVVVADTRGGKEVEEIRIEINP